MIVWGGSLYVERDKSFIEEIVDELKQVICIYDWLTIHDEEVRGRLTACNGRKIKGQECLVSIVSSQLPYAKRRGGTGRV